MGAAYFYHLTESPLEGALPVLLDKARERGWRIEVRGTDAARLARLDTALWTSGDPASFLAHGLAGGAHDAEQPILLTTPDQAAANDAGCVMAIHGADVTVAEVAAHDRVCIVFADADRPALGKARSQWKQLTDAGCAAVYWAQEAGRWVKKFEKEAAPAA